MRLSIVLACAAVFVCGCFSAPPATPRIDPLASVIPRNLPPPPAPDEWNLLPNPTTGEIEVYHRGAFQGVIDGTEPPGQNPPLPHPPHRSTGATINP
jgi:hypothetical protein